MQGSSVRTEVGGEGMELLPGRAIFWPAKSALLVADLHIGKGAAFRVGSIAVPAGSSAGTLDRLSALINRTYSKKLYILGDFWHAKEGRTDEIHAMLSEWRDRHRDVEMLLIEGNHDKRSGVLPSELGIETVQDLVIEGLVLKHHPEEDERGYVLAGHIHPGVRLVGAGRQVEKLPAFIFGERVGILPAFGEFTGAATVFPVVGDRVFVVAGNDVVEVGLASTASLR